MIFPRLSNKRQPSARPVVLITGSEGLIGSRIVKALSRSYEVIGLDVKKSQRPSDYAEFIECDLTKTENVNRSLHQIQSRYGRALASVIHLAAYYDFSG